MALVLIIILVLIVAVLVIYNISIHKRLNEFNNIQDRLSNLGVLQKFMDTIGEDMLVEEKIAKINQMLIDNFDIKYSTIVVFDGAEYVIKATNVSEKHWETMKNLHNDDMFKDSITSAIPKYVTINKESERLSYQKEEMGRAKSAMFFPMYIDNIYYGYWIIEHGTMHAFDNIDTSILGVIKDNIISVLKSTNYQNTIENIYRIDKTTGLKSAEYLYGKGQLEINKYAQSAIGMFQIINIEEINEKFGRNIGTEMIIQVCNEVKKHISSDYLFVRYMGPKFVVCFLGNEQETISDFVVEIKEKIESNVKIKIIKNNKAIYAKAKTNFVFATYYKGTGLEEVLKKLEEYLDTANKKESNINYI